MSQLKSILKPKICSIQRNLQRYICVDVTAVYLVLGGIVAMRNVMCKDRKDKAVTGYEIVVRQTLKFMLSYFTKLCIKELKTRSISGYYIL